VFRLLRALLLLIVAIVAAILVTRWYTQRRGGFSARAEPSAFETAIALRARRLMMPADARSRTSPIPPSPDAVRAGMEHFADHCAICHGNDGSGQSELGKGLYPKPPDMRQPRTQSLSDGEIFWIIQNGVRFTGMPAFGGGDEDASAQADAHAHAPADAHVHAPAAGEHHDEGEHHSEEDTWKLVQFIRHLPKLTQQELSEMERLNPRGPDEREEQEKIDDLLGGRGAAPPPAHSHGGRGDK
jgi:mono/diheme cytochrome c family protein